VNLRAQKTKPLFNIYLPTWDSVYRDIIQSLSYYTNPLSYVRNEFHTSE